MLRRSADGPEPGCGQGLGAPWTPALLTRCERPGREYRVLNSRFERRSARGLTSQDYFGPCEPVRGCETSRPLGSRSGGHSLARAASRPRRVAPFRNGRIVRERERGEDTATSRHRGQGAAVDSDLAARRPSVTASARSPH